RLAWFEHPDNPYQPWIRHDISRRKRGMFDKFIPLDLDDDGDIDFLSTRGNSLPYDGVFWLEQIRTKEPVKSFVQARKDDSKEMGLSDRKID
ncbi:MAG: VCBS repeat-containing protein, partial [Flavobacteriaceae bacterium]|nr:VCBS repeat-containing protein [Flavobacteriaceae bacterium]